MDDQESVPFFCEYDGYRGFNVNPKAGSGVDLDTLLDHDIF